MSHYVKQVKDSCMWQISWYPGSASQHETLPLVDGS